MGEWLFWSQCCLLQVAESPRHPNPNSSLLQRRPRLSRRLQRRLQRRQRPAVEAPAAPLVTPAPAILRTRVEPVAPTVAAAPSTAVFPSAISPTYANEKPYKARRKTCSDQFKANKATNANGGLKWIQKGGGYWNECNKHLKG